MFHLSFYRIVEKSFLRFFMGIDEIADDKETENCDRGVGGGGQK